MTSYWTDRSARSGGPLRLVVELIVCLVIGVVVVQSWLVERFVVPSASMAETLHGVHRTCHCPACGWTFAAAADPSEQPLPKTAVCPNCGDPFAPLAALPDDNGDRLLVQKTAFAERAPRRFEPIVFRCPDVAEMVYVKRVVGLPGESVRIVGGDLYIDGHLQRKSLEQCRALAVTVYDDRFRPQEAVDARAAAAQPSVGLPPRFQGDAAESRWQRDGERFVFTPDDGSSIGSVPAQVDWLSYRHWRRLRGFPDRTEEVPINDDCGYNQSQSRLLNYVGDVGLRCLLRCHGAGDLWLSTTDGRDRLRVRIVPASGLVELWRDEQVVSRAELGHPLAADWARLELLLFDRQLLVALDDVLLLPPYVFEPSAQPLAPTSRPLAVGSAGLYVEVSDLEVLRDVYYTAPLSPTRAWGVAEAHRLKADEYFVLGDNSSLSEDSRYWAVGPAVRTELLVGKPFLVHLPSQAVEVGPLRFQFPRFSEVRYIR